MSLFSRVPSIPNPIPTLSSLFTVCPCHIKVDSLHCPLSFPLACTIDRNHIYRRAGPRPDPETPASLVPRNQLLGPPFPRPNSWTTSPSTPNRPIYLFVLQSLAPIILTLNWTQQWINISAPKQLSSPFRALWLTWNDKSATATTQLANCRCLQKLLLPRKIWPLPYPSPNNPSVPWL